MYTCHSHRDLLIKKSPHMSANSTKQYMASNKPLVRGTMSSEHSSYSLAFKIHMLIHPSLSFMMVATLYISLFMLMI